MKRTILLLLLAIVVGTATATDRRQINSLIDTAQQMMTDYQYDSAWVVVLQVLDLDPDNGLALLMGAMCGERGGLYGHALSMADRSLLFLPKKDKEDRAHAHMVRARVHLALGDTAAALQACDEMIALMPRATWPLEFRMDIYEDAGDYERALCDVRHIQQLAPDAMYYVALEASYLIQLEEYAAAIERFTLAFSSMQDSWEILSDRAMCHLLLGHTDECMDDLIAAMEINCYVFDYWDYIEALTDEEVTQLVLRLKQKIEQDPRSFDWQTTLAVTLYLHSIYPDAVVELEQAYSLRPYRFLSHLIAKSYREMHDTEWAMYYLNEATDGLREYDEVYEMTRCRILMDMGAYWQAIDCLEKYLEHFPESEDAHSRMGKCYVNLRKLVPAIECYERAQLINPGNSYYPLMIGECHWMLCDTAEANASLRQAIRMGEHGDDMLTAIAYAYLGDTISALRADSVYRQRHPDAGLYNRVCVLALVGDTARAINCLEQHVDNGYRNAQYIRMDLDLRPLHDCPRFVALLERLDSINTATHRRNDILEGVTEEDD